MKVTQLFKAAVEYRQSIVRLLRHFCVCKNFDQLKLKIVVHSGEALFHQIGGFPDISSVDVILVHRLLKNSIKSDEYVLMTEAAYRDISFPHDIEVSQNEEHYPGFGSIPTFTYVAKGGGPRLAMRWSTIMRHPSGPC